MSAAGARGGLICMHAENGIVINEIIKHALARVIPRPKYHALTRPTVAEAEGVHRAIAIAEMAESPVYIVHLSCADALQSGAPGARPGHSRVRRELVRSIFSLSIDDYGDGLGRRESSDDAAAAREVEPGRALERVLKMDDLQVISTIIVRSCMKEQKSWARMISPRFPTVAPALSIASRHLQRS
jgi:dihydropyrimidinase